MARYECTTKTFIAPHLMVEGQQFSIDDAFVPGPHLIPLDEAAEKAMSAYYEANPGASLNPLEDRPVQFQPSPDPTILIPSPDEVNISLAEATTTKASPDLSGGGKAGKIA